MATVPREPAVYAVRDFSDGVAYVGISRKLRDRLEQHFLRRDSSVTTGVAAAVLLPEHVQRVDWWTDPAFADPGMLAGAEIVAFDVLQPTLRSRWRATSGAQEALATGGFVERVTKLLTAEPAGSFHPRNLRNLAAVVANLAERLGELEGRVAP